MEKNEEITKRYLKLAVTTTVWGFIGQNKEGTPAWDAFSILFILIVNS